MTFSVEVLGPLRVLADGRPLELGPARRRALLAALVVDVGRVVPLDTAADRVWDGAPPDGATATVQAYMSRLRASLRAPVAQAPEGRTPDDEGPLLTRAPGYVLDLPADAVDAHRFQSLVARGHELAAAGDHHGARGALTAALELWRGAPYLDVAALFARREAERLTELRLSALELAARTDLALGRSAGLVEELRALVRDEPLREGLHAALLVALYREGRQAEALQHFEAVRELLADELGIDPGVELRRLQQQVLRQDPALDPPPTPTTPPRSEGPQPARVEAPQQTGPSELVEQGSRPGVRLHGRRSEVERLTAALARAAAGEPAFVAVVGEAGIGKTRLVEEVTAAAAARGALVAWGHCWQHEGAPLLWPWTQALSQVAAALEPGALEEALGGRATEAAALLARPSGGRGREEPADDPAAPPSAAPTRPASLDAARVRLYDAVAALLEAVAARRPVVVVLDDGHWADLATRELLEYLATTVRGARLAVVVTVRGGAEDAARTGPELLGALARTGRALRVELRGLGEQDVRDCVADRTGSVLDDATTAALTERTGGNPFFVAELVRLLVTDVASGAEPVLPDTVPDTVREVVLRRVRRMPEADQAVLTTAAVVGRSFDPDLLEAACGLGADAVDEALDRATEAGVVRSDPESPGHHQFVHALTQQAVLETTGPARLRRLHGRIAQALASRGTASAATSATRVERLSFHLVGSGGVAELLQAVDLQLAAAEASWRSGLYAEVESLLLRALDVVTRLDGAEADRREMAVRLRLWSLYTMTDGPGTHGALGHHARAMQLVGEYGGAVEVMTAHQAALADALWHGHLGRVEALAAEMAAAAEAADDDLMRLAASLALGQQRFYRGRLQEAIACFAAAAERAGALADVPVGVFPLDPAANLPLWQGLALAVLGKDDAVQERLDAVRASLRGASVTTTAYVPTMVALLHALRDDPEAALPPAEDAVETARRHGFTEAQLFVDVVAAWARERCRPGTALGGARAALDASLQRPSMAMRPTLRALVADVLVRAGDAAGALEQVEAALAEAVTSGDVVADAECHRLRALCWRQLGRAAAEVLAEAEAAVAVARSQGAALFAARAGALVSELRPGASGAHARRTG